MRAGHRVVLFLAVMAGSALLLTSPVHTSISRNHLSDKEIRVKVLNGDRLFDAWVTFRDKGIETEHDGRMAMDDLERTFNGRALERRRLRRTRPGLFDEFDFPLVESYMNSVAGTGAEVRVQSRWLNGVSILATEDQIEVVRNLPCVLEVAALHEHLPLDLTQPVPERHRADDRPVETPGFYGRSDGQIRQLGLDRLHDAGFTGKGVLIAVLDTGFDTVHEAFNSSDHPLSVVTQWDFMNNDGNTAIEEMDTPIQHEHGSLILGTIGAYSPGELVGSAFDASFLLCNPEDDATEYFLEERWFVAALEFAEANGADIATSSLVLYTGYDPEDMDGETSVMTRGWNLATGNGVIGFQGGGNDGHDEDPATAHLLPPSDAIDVITVGSVNIRDQIVTFTSDGPTVDGRLKPELLALGWNVWTTSPFDRDGYTLSAGSSLATPVLAGAAACLLQAHPAWSIAEIRAALFHSGNYYREHGIPDPLFIQGFGIPDLYLAAGLDATGKR